MYIVYFYYCPFVKPFYLLSNMSSESFLNFCNKLYLQKYIYVGYSGGVDSRVLLDLLYRNYYSLNYYSIIAVYVRHGTDNIYNSFWEDYCINICLNLNIPIIVVSVKNSLFIKKKKTEDFLRGLRFFSFEVILYGVVASLCLGQHLDDHIETLLYKVSRGLSLCCLLGITMKISFRTFHVVRPLLKWYRKDVLDYSKKYNLYWVNDSTNFSNLYYRNIIRNLYIGNRNLLLLPISIFTSYIKQLNFFVNITCEAIFSVFVDTMFMYKMCIRGIYKLPLFVKKEIMRVWFIRNDLTAPKYTTILAIYNIIIFSRLFYSYLKLEFCFIIKYNKFMFIYKL